MKYVLASDELKNRLQAEAWAWVDETDIPCGSDSFAANILSEYDANKRGFTIYESKADYPK